MPIPFSLSAVTLLACTGISKLIHPETVISISFFSLLAVLATICNVFYLVTDILQMHSLKIYLLVLITGVFVNYLNNILFLFVAKNTLQRDEGFLEWRRGHVKLIRDARD